ncbi:hypothetical protein COV04_03050 [Candidatus Uhrbacteria bacterium CG10_big_fil_rev_8_21_14_0_10_48_11]|uniref:Uncharacterized protein n=1 Tax=Candidatus Uhrbacteria bacterium CG10_big_fil_rev_8_21_14_0_10_48_11 TaxID=1975037 RepID=A0A2M8LEP7_9BACT|nr:MAG: hypothetical protein COV04_03050 [Candidatus Uhrbacteria bacterium CG10_big_fil_rev_8_21_14_0_10_48_11]
MAEESWTYTKTVVDVLREPLLIRDKNFCVWLPMSYFIVRFKWHRKRRNKKIYELGNGQWAIPALRKFLEDLLPKNTFFKGFEVDHAFPRIGQKIMILSAR